MIIVTRGKKILSATHSKNHLNSALRIPLESMMYQGHFILPLYDTNFFVGDAYGNSTPFEGYEHKSRVLSFQSDGAITMLASGLDLPDTAMAIKEEIPFDPAGVLYANNETVTHWGTALLALGLPISEIVYSTSLQSGTPKTGYYLFDLEGIKPGKQIDVKEVHRGEVKWGDWAAIDKFFGEKAFNPKTFWKENYPDGEDAKLHSPAQKKKVTTSEKRNTPGQRRNSVASPRGRKNPIPGGSRV